MGEGAETGSSVYQHRTSTEAEWLFEASDYPRPSRNSYAVSLSFGVTCKQLTTGFSVTMSKMTGKSKNKKKKEQSKIENLDKSRKESSIPDGMLDERSIVAEVNGRRTELTVFEWTLAVRNNRQTNDPFTSPSQLITVQIIRHLLLSPADSVCEHGRVERLDFGYCFRVNDRGQCGQTVAVLSANSSTD
ncbi:hypothetical protein T08_7700 [Trichinella sp. T8]|nr:hypothetical protein T08_7700 [Trichinella sp. T8]